MVTIDGGEWLQGAGEFNMLEQIPQEMWDMLEMMIKAKKILSTFNPENIFGILI